MWSFKVPTKRNWHFQRAIHSTAFSTSGFGGMCSENSLPSLSAETGNQGADEINPILSNLSKIMQGTVEEQGN